MGDLQGITAFNLTVKSSLLLVVVCKDRIFFLILMEMTLLKVYCSGYEVSWCWRFRIHKEIINEKHKRTKRKKSTLFLNILTELVASNPND